LYVVLGVSRNETHQGLRDAFHSLAPLSHPDRAGDEPDARFQEIVGAYEVLSDRAARRSYDRSLEDAERRSGAWGMSTGSEAPEPLISGSLALLSDFDVVAPPVDEILERIERNFTGLGIPKSERLAPLDLTLVLSPSEARLGGAVRFAVPVYQPCPVCHSSAESWPFDCTTCAGHGAVISEQEVALTIPPRIPEGSVFEVPLRGLRIENLYLRVSTRLGA
jgi:DnaJ-class molecular chaperone